MVEGTRSVAQLIFLSWNLAERCDSQEPIHQGYRRISSRLSSNAQKRAVLVTRPVIYIAMGEGGWKSVKALQRLERRSRF